MTLSSARSVVDVAADSMDRCRFLAAITDIPGNTTRTYLSPAMRSCMEAVQSWMTAAGMSVSIDAVGNLRGFYPGNHANSPRLIIGSHLDTVPNAGAFDGVLGVVLGLALVELLAGQTLSFGIELIAFSEEEGVRFRTPFIGSRAVVGRVDEALLARRDEQGISVSEAMTDFGLSLDAIEKAVLHPATRAFLEFHIEQGPLLESTDGSLGVVEVVAGQTRGEVTFLGASNHAGTTPMHLRRDAVTAAAQWISKVEELARETLGLVATVGGVEVHPSVGNVIAGEVHASLDVRHADDAVRRDAVEKLLGFASSISQQRGLSCEWKMQMDQAAVRMDAPLSQMAYDAIRSIGTEPLRMISGAGHDAMVMAERVPSTMIFLRSPGGISHHPDESVRQEDVTHALAAGLNFLQRFDEAITKDHA